MKTSVLSALALLVSFSFAAPQAVKKDVNIFLQEPHSTKASDLGTTRLPPGQYVIRSPYFAPGLAIGRSYREDKSLLPKRILTILESEGQQVWKLEPGPDGAYFLQNAGAWTANIEGQVYAVLLGYPERQAWVLNNVGGDVYTITSSDGREAWFADSDLDSQVEIKSFDPNNAPPNALFKFINIYDGLNTSGSHEKANVKIDVDVKVEEL